MHSTVENFKESKHLNKIFSYLIIYYWGLFYFSSVSYIIVTLPISIFIAYLSLTYIQNFSRLSSFSFILLFVLSSVYLSFIRLDMTSLIAVLLFGMTIYYIDCFSLKIDLNLLNRIFLLSIIISVPLFYSGYSIYGFFPGQGGFSHDEFLSGRISLFPNVASSIYFSFIIFFINLFFNKNFYQKLFFLGLSLYFIYFGISRTVMLGLAFLLMFSWLFKVYPIRKNLFYQFFLPLILIVGPIIFVYFIEDIISFLLGFNSEFISEYFFRGYSTVDKIMKDIARVSIWSEHLRLFFEYPWGLSTQEINMYVNSNLELSDGGSESFLTRILMRYGFGSIFLYLFLLSLLTRATVTRNEYLYVFVYMFIFIGVSYGSFFAAYNMLFLVFVSSLNNKQYVIRK